MFVMPMEPMQQARPAKYGFTLAIERMMGAVIEPAVSMPTVAEPLTIRKR